MSGEVGYPRRLEGWQLAHLATAAGRVHPVYDDGFWRGWHELAERVRAEAGTGCRFGAGSLACVAVDCPNPHHRG